MSYLFIASILLAEGATLVWMGWTLELAARGGAIGFALMNVGLEATTGWPYCQSGGSVLLGWTVVCGLLPLSSVGLAAISG